MVKAVIFDLDGTLCDYNQAHKPALDNLMYEGGRLLNVSEKEFAIAYEWGKSQVKKTIPTAAASHNRLLYIENALEFLGFMPALYALELYEKYWETFLENMMLCEGAIELLDYLQSKNIKMCLCSDLTAHIQYRKLKKLGIDSYFNYIVTSEEAGAEKPDERMFRLALDKLGINADETLFVGDSYERDIEGAKNVGIRAVHIASKEVKINVVLDIIDSEV